MKKKLLFLNLLLISICSFGQSWVAQNTGFASASRGLRQLHIVDANTVWGLAYDGAPSSATDPEIQEFTRTINGGTNWTAGFIEIGQAGWTINNISAISGLVAWVSAIDLTGGAGAPTPGGIWKTVDGGITWVRQLPTGFVGAGSFINGVYFWDANEGIAYGDPIAANKIECYKTLNGGATWTAIVPGPAMISGEYNYNNGNVFNGDTVWLPTNKGFVLRSSNRGTTWTKLSGPTGITDFGGATVNASLHYSNPTNGVCLGTTDAGATYKLFSTTNGGLTWATPAGNFAGGFNRLLSYVPGTSVLVACGANTTPPAVPGSSFSNDNGTTFTQIDTGSQRGTVKMLTTSVGWTAGFSALTPNGTSVGGIFKLSGTLSNEIFSSSKLFSISPNPTTGLVNISCSEQFRAISIFDIAGKEIFSKNFESINQQSLELSGFQAGAYFMKITAESKTETIKIIKQ